MRNDLAFPRASESQEQTAFVERVLYQFGTRADFLSPLFFATLSGHWIGGTGAKRFALIEKYKREGWQNGTADLLYLQPRGPYSYLAIEMKAVGRRGEKDGGLSEDQAVWLNAARQAKALAVICYGADEAMMVFEKYMGYPA